MPQLDRYIVFSNVLWLLLVFFLIYNFNTFFFLPQIFINLAVRQKRSIILKSKDGFLISGRKKEELPETLNLFYKKNFEKYSNIYLRINLINQVSDFYKIQLRNLFNLNFINFSNKIINNLKFDEILFNYMILEEENKFFLANLSEVFIESNINTQDNTDSKSLENLNAVVDITEENSVFETMAFLNKKLACCVINIQH